MSDGLSLSALARALGRSKSGLHKAAANGRIPQRANGLFDIAAVERALARNTDPARIKPERSRSPENEAGEQANTRPVVTTEADAQAAIALIARVLKAEGGDAPVEIDFNAARTADTILKAYERDLKIAQRRKELVPLTAVQGHVERAFIGLRQIVQRLPSRHAAGIAAELGCDAAALDAAFSKAIAAELDGMSAPVVRA